MQLNRPGFTESVDFVQTRLSQDVAKESPGIFKIKLHNSDYFFQIDAWH